MGSSERTNIAGALFTKTQQRIFGLLFGQSNRAFTITDIIKRTQSGTGAVQRELVRLVESGIVTVRNVGNQRHYQANAAAPIFEELRSIVVKTIGVADPIRRALHPLSKRIDLALLHGSLARAADHAGSDIDLLVVASKLTLEELLARLEPLQRRLGRPIHPTLYTPAEFQRRRDGKNPFLQKVLSGDYILLMGETDGLTAA